jgi:hypothetical protein
MRKVVTIKQESRKKILMLLREFLIIFEAAGFIEWNEFLFGL